MDRYDIALGSMLMTILFYVINMIIRAIDKHDTSSLHKYIHTPLVDFLINI